jgi:hypothetical protein
MCAPADLDEFQFDASEGRSAHHRDSASSATLAIPSGKRHNVRMLTSVATIVGLAGVIISVTLLAWQTRAVAQQTKISNAIASASVISNSTSGLREVLSIFVEHPELRPYFYGSRRPPFHGHRRERIVTVAEILADILEEGLSVNRLVQTSRFSEEWPLYCADMLTSSPALNEIIQQNPNSWELLRALQPRSTYRPRGLNYQGRLSAHALSRRRSTVR